jgi:adenylate cyclase
VNCSGCGLEVTPGFAFCPKCGRRLPRSCGGCGFACEPDFAFCPKCGAPVEPTAAPPPAPVVTAPVAPTPAAEADRRLVTVLFADVSGFTTLSERHDPEDVRAFQNDLFAMLAGAIEQYGGFVEKFVGDAVMAVFGAPIAHEDDAERALHAALAMLERMAGLSARWEPCFGGPVSLHLGINSGPVVAGRLGSGGDAAYAVTGDTVNTAARLLSASEDGQVLVSGSTHRLTARAFAFDPLPALSLRGKAEPVEVWRLRGLLAAAPSGHASDATGLAAPLVGREDELGQIVAVFERAARGRAQVVSLIGDAGTGKSRLVAEFFAVLEASGRLGLASVRRATCSSLGEQAYGVLRAFLREGYQLATDDTLETAIAKLSDGLRALGSDKTEADRVAPVLAHVLGLESDDGLRHLEPEQVRRQIFLAARLVVERRLQHGPVVFVIENLHWADVASIELLRFLADRLHDRPLMLLVTARPGFDAQAVLTTRAAHTMIRLAPLDDAQSGALLEGLLGSPAHGLPSALNALVVRRAGGNPLYVVEIVRTLIATGALARNADGWVCAGDLSALDVPPTIQGLLLSRVDRLPPDARRLLQDAAVLGLAFRRDVLHGMAGAPPRFDAMLEVLREAELVDEVAVASGSADASAKRHRFSQALVQEVVYQNLLLARRTEAHDRAGEAYHALSTGQAQKVEDIEALGHHWSLGADRLRGARFLVAAGDRGRAVHANEDALRNYERALRTLRECGARDEQCPVRERLGDLVATLGRRAEAIEHYEAVRDHCAAVGDARAQARLHRKLGGLHWDAGDRDRALDCFQAGLALLEGGGEDVESAHLYQEMGRLAFRSGDNQRAIEWAERALVLTEPCLQDGPDPDLRREAAAVVAHACNTVGVALARTDRREQAAAHIERSIAVALSQDLLQAACRGYTNLGILYSTLDPSQGIAICLQGLETAKRIGDLGVQSRLYANLAVAYCALTDRCEAEGIEAAQASIELDRQLGQLDHLAVPLVVLGQIYQCHGDPEHALACYREALGIVEEAGEPQLLFPCYDGLATLHLDLGDEAEAERYLTLAQDVCARAGLDPDSLVLLPFLG